MDIDPRRDVAVRDSATARALIGVAVAVAILFGVWLFGQSLLLFFGGVLIGVLFLGLAEILERHTPLSIRWALSIVLVLATVLLIGGGWLLAPRVYEQLSQLTQELQGVLDRLSTALERLPLSRQVLQRAQDFAIGPGSPVLGAVPDLATAILGVVSGAAIVLFLGIYLAYEPSLYVSGVVRLFPKAKRERTRQVMHEIGLTLRWWLIGRVIAMAAVGALATIGLWILGVPLALSLGLIAAALDFVPFIGPIVAAIPAVLLGYAEGLSTALWVIGLYVLVQAVEGYVVTPIVQQRTVSLPPALTLGALLIGGSLFGVLGVFLATPLAAALMVAVRMAYVEDVLDDRAPSGQ